MAIEPPLCVLLGKWWWGLSTTLYGQMVVDPSLSDWWLEGDNQQGKTVVEARLYALSGEQRRGPIIAFYGQAAMEPLLSKQRHGGDNWWCKMTTKPWLCTLLMSASLHNHKIARQRNIKTKRTKIEWNACILEPMISIPEKGHVVIYHLYNRVAPRYR